MARSRYKTYELDAPYFLTCTVIQWLPLFTKPDTVNILLESFKYLQTRRNVKIHGYVILENHLHLVARSPAIANDIGDFKSFTARKIIDSLEEKNIETFFNLLTVHKLSHKIDRQYQLWQEGIHPKQIQTDTMMRQKLEYIHMNPVKRGYVDNPIHWRYSSARNYEGLDGLVEIDKTWYC